MILLVGLFGVFVLAAAVVQVLAKDFLVPIMALEDLDFADGWHRLLAMIGLEKGRYAVYLLLKLVLSIAAAILFGIIAIIPALFVVVPAVVAVLAGRAAGMGWSVTTDQSGDNLRNLVAAPPDLPDRSGKRAGHCLLPCVRAAFSSRSISESRRAAASGPHACRSGIAYCPGVLAAVRSASLAALGGTHRLKAIVEERKPLILICYIFVRCVE